MNNIDKILLLMISIVTGLLVAILLPKEIKSEVQLEPYKVVITKKNGKLHKVYYYKNN